MRIISGIYRGKILSSAPENITRPTSDRAKEGLFNIITTYAQKNNLVWHDIIFADIFAGSGAIGAEALSRGAKQAFFIENHPTALSFLQKNTINMPATILSCDANAPTQATAPCHILFFDPPYGDNAWHGALMAFDKMGWIDKSSLIIIETDKKNQADIPAGFLVQDTRAYGRNMFIFLKKV